MSRSVVKMAPAWPFILHQNKDEREKNHYSSDEVDGWGCLKTDPHPTVGYVVSLIMNGH